MTSLQSRGTPGLARLTLRSALVACALLAGACSTPGGPAVAPVQSRPNSTPSGAAYVGWRVYQEHCAACHGKDGEGPARVPGLLANVREMSARRFANLVLQRYDWAQWSQDEDPDRIDLLEDILLRKENPMVMPAWEDQPRVAAHVMDLYAYLSARADGALGVGQPPR
jgi:mono/diheme cytochrome c family protein